MIDREKLIKSIRSQIAVAEEIKSDFITLTVGQGRKLLTILETPSGCHKKAPESSEEI